MVITRDSEVWDWEWDANYLLFCSDFKCIRRFKKTNIFSDNIEHAAVGTGVWGTLQIHVTSSPDFFTHFTTCSTKARVFGRRNGSAELDEWKSD